MAEPLRARPVRPSIILFRQAVVLIAALALARPAFATGDATHGAQEQNRRSRSSCYRPRRMPVAMRVAASTG